MMDNRLDGGREDSVQPGLGAVQGILFFAVCCGLVIMIQWVMVNYITHLFTEDTTMAVKTDMNIEFENGRMPVLIPSGEIIEKFEGRFQ